MKRLAVFLINIKGQRYNAWGMPWNTCHMWLVADDSGDITGACTIDMNAAFDAIETNLLIEKFMG